jgi:hypothetical protein
MRKFLYAAAALALAGCSSYSEIARWDSDTLTNDGEKPVASFVTQNFSYQLFGLIPLCTGLPWTEGDEDIMDDFNVRFFADEATIDNNMVSLRHALDRAGGSHRITKLHTTVDNEFFWSLCIINRHEVRTQCLILP